MEKIKHYFQKIREGRLKEIFKDLIWIYRYGRSHIFAIIIYTVLGLTGIVISLMSNLVSRDLVDIITGHNSGELVKTFVTLIGITILTTVISEISSLISAKISVTVENDIKADLYDKILSSEWEELNKFHSGDIMSRWSSGASVIATGILTTIPGYITSFFRFASALYMVVRYDITFAVFALAGVPISYLASKANLKRMQNTNMSTMTTAAKMASFTQESFSNLQTVKAFDLLYTYRKKLKGILKDSADMRMKYQRTSLINNIIMVCVSLLVTYSTYGWGVYKVWSGGITYGTMTMFLALSTTLSGTTQSLINLLPTTLNLTNTAKRVMAIVELPKEDYSQHDEVTAFFKKNASQGVGLAIRNAAFTYMNGTEVFEHVNIDAHPKEVIALVGPSGEGKTTMLRLILAIIKAKQGKGYIMSGDLTPEKAGINMDDPVTGMGDTWMPLTASTRQLFAYVPQGNTMFSGTISENMRMVKEDATDEEIIDALKIACAWDFVEKLPDGIETLMQERGGGFSEGQAQRLSIARAILRKSPILLLDEATSALDIWTERKLLENIMKDDYPRTTIVTTHRPTVLTSCDRVYAVRNKGCDLMTKDEVHEMINFSNIEESKE